MVVVLPSLMGNGCWLLTVALHDWVGVKPYAFLFDLLAWPAHTGSCHRLKVLQLALSPTLVPTVFNAGYCLVLPPTPPPPPPITASAHADEAHVEG